MQSESITLRATVKHQLLVEILKYGELVNTEETNIMIGLRRGSAIRATRAIISYN